LAVLAKKHDRVLAVGYNRRYSLLYRQAKEILGDRRVELAVIQKHRTEASNPSLFAQYLDDTIHQIDLMRFYCGDAEAADTQYQMREGVLVSAVSTVRLPAGGQGIITICNQSSAWQESATLHTADLSVHVDAFQCLRVMRDDREEVFGTDRAGKWLTSLKERGFYGEVDHFLHCVRARENPQTDAAEAAKTQLLLENLVRASGDPVPE
jgi:virulence factor